MEMLKIGFVGGGKMAQALAKGFIKAGLCRGETMIASCLPSDENSIQEFKAMNSKAVFSNSEVVENSDILVLAVKPQVLPSIFPEIGDSLKNKKSLLMSIAMGVTLKNLESKLPAGTRIIRVMPNTPSLVQCGATVFVRGTHAKQEDTEIAKKLFSSIGLCEEVPEHMVDSVTALAGSGPAYVYMMIEALADGAVKMGLPRTIAYRLASQTVLGAGKMVKETNIHPAELKDNVASPAGTTIAAIHCLEQKGFRSALISAIEVATMKSREVALSTES